MEKNREFESFRTRLTLKKQLNFLIKKMDENKSYAMDLHQNGHVTKDDLVHWLGYLQPISKVLSETIDKVDDEEFIYE